MREKDRLAARLRERNVQQAKDAKRSAARRSDRETQTPKLSAIQELKRKREAKTQKSTQAAGSSVSKRSKRDYSSSEEDDSQDDFDDDEIDSGEEFDSPATRANLDKYNKGREARAEEDLEGSKEITYEDALQIRMSRKSCVKFMYYPDFPETVVNCFVRIAVGGAGNTYRVCQVSGMQIQEERSRPYRLPNGDLCKRAFELSHGSSKKTFEFTYLSDSPFTQEEFDKWHEACKKDKMNVMNKRKLKAKLTQLKHMGDHQLTNAEISAMVDEKRKLTKIPPNVAAEKIRLSGLITEARENNNGAKVEEYQNELAKIEELTSNRGKNGDLDRLSKLNEKNRQQNLKVIGKAEIENANKRQQAEINGKSGGDPFSRLKTRPRTFYESTPTSSVPGSPSILPASTSQQSKQDTTVKNKKLGGIDNLIG